MNDEDRPAPTDFDAIAPDYDAHRGAGPFSQELARLARECSARHVFEIGAGTGNVSRAFLEQHPCRLVGVDRSQGMLARARAKVPEAAWVQGDAFHLPLSESSVDFVFGVYVLHHLTDLARPLRECRRVLRNGCAAFVTAPQAFIRSHPMNRFFPSFATIDGARFQPEKDIERALLDAGFAAAGTIEVQAPPQPINAAYVKKVADRFITTYRLLPPEEFKAGLKRLREEVETKGRLDEPLAWRAAVVWGRV